MFHSFVQLQYCYDYLVNQIPVGLLIYSHFPTALLALLFGGYVFYKVRKLSSFTLLIVCITFALWCLFDLSSWFSFLGANITMFTWSLVDLFGLVFFLFAYYFLYTFLLDTDLPSWQKVIGVLMILPTLVWTALGMNLAGFDANTCEALENEFIANYPYFVEGIVILSVLALGTRCWRKASLAAKRSEAILATIGVLIFLGFFFASTLAVNLLVNYSIVDYAYNFEIYGLFGMPILLVYLGYLIVRFQAFNLKVFAAQALVVGLIVLIASEYAFLQSNTNRILVTITLLLTMAVGIVLIRSVKREIEQREHIETLARDLANANEQQVILIHFITHQIKGFVAKSRNIFSLMVDGDYGVLPETAKTAAQIGLDSDTKGAQTIAEILNAANIKSGKVSYTMEAFDLKALIEGIVKDLTPSATHKGLSLTATLAPITYTGDKAQLVNAFKNLIDNSIKYTQQGSVAVSLAQQESSVRFEIVDTGVGITPEDMKGLFVEGGRGKNSQKINVESTGFGLYIVKNIIEAHKGRVWAESEGEGKGSRFIVELPIGL